MKHAYAARDLSAALQPWRRRLALQRGLVRGLWGLAGGTGLAIVLLLAARFVPWPGVWLWAVIIPAAGLAAGLVYGLVSRPSIYRTAIRVDRLTGLADRLSTAWELRQGDTPMACLQRENALESLKGYKPEDVIRLRPSLRMFAPPLAGIVLAGLLVLLPNPMDKVIQERQEFRARLEQGAAEGHQDRGELVEAEPPLRAGERAA